MRGKKKEWQGEEWLVCDRCGYKQYDTWTVLAFKKRYPGTPAYDIPYLCGACMDQEEEEDEEDEGGSTDDDKV